MKELDVKEFIQKHKKDWVLISMTIFVTIFMIVGLSYISSTAVSNGNTIAGIYVPIEFLESRNRAASAAEKITSLTNISASNLERINDADQRGDYAEGVNLVVKEIERNREIGDAAVDLSEELREMAKNLNVVRPAEVGSIGFRAVTTGIELVQRLVSYNNNTQELLSTLQTRLNSGGDERTHARIEELISALNEEAKAINRLDSEYRDLMTQFDGLTG